MKSPLQIQKRRNASFTVTLEYLAVLGVYLFALSWPLGAFQRILWPIHLYHLALIPAFVHAGVALKRNKRLRTPFELWWPCLAIFLITLLLWLQGHAGNPLETGMLCLSFVVITHVVRNRKLVLQTLSLFLFSACVMAFLSLLSAFYLLFPTTIHLDSRWVMAGPYSLQTGMLSLLTGVVLIPVLIAATKNGEHKPGKSAVVLWLALPLFLGLFCMVSPRCDLALLAPGHTIFLTSSVVPMVLLLWVIVRIMAKMWVASSFMAPGAYHWFLGVLFVVTLLLLWATPAPTIGYIFLLAVIAGYGQPYVVSNAETRLVPVLAGVVAVVLAVNISFVLPGDPRNYERDAQAALAQKDENRILTQLEFVKEIAPEESLADYYIARVYLQQDELSRAAQAFSFSLRNIQPRLLPAPDEAHIDQFLSEMREKSSALPEKMRGLAYEQALVAAGRERHALSLLELRGNPDASAAFPAWPLAAALASILKAPELTETLAQWDGTLLAGILESAGAENSIVVAPEAFPQNLLPFVAVASNVASQDILQIYTPLGAHGGMRIAGVGHPPLMDVALAMSAPKWKTWQQNAAGVWTLAFGKVAEIHILNTPEVFFSVYPTPPVDSTSEVVIFMPGK